MEKELFIDVLKHYHKSSESEALNIVALKQNFPYSQVLQVLSARVGKDHGYNDSQNALQMAAVYAADRSVLKDVMTKDYLQPAPIRDIQSYNVPAPVVERVFERSEYVEGNEGTNAAYSHDNEVIINGSADGGSTILSSSNGSAEADSLESHGAEVVMGPAVEVSRESNSDQHSPLLPGADGSVADQVMGDLEKLSQSRHNFEEMFKDFEKTFASDERSESPVVNSDLQNNVEVPAASNVLNSESSDENKYSVTQHEESKPHPNDPEEFKSRPMPRRKLQPPTIIDEIEHTKEELEPENPKQKEQLEMIDQFIRTQPSLTASRDKQFELADSDLTTIRTGEFSDNIVSETLVEILLKQGKKDKAIEVLKKLIWKFPQKKAYFAAQIEELKK